MSIPRIARGLTGFVGAVFAGGMSAALFALALARAETLLIFVAYLTAVPLFLAGMSAGGIAGFVATFAGTAGLYLAVPSNIAFVYSFVFGIPAALLTMLALRYRMGEKQKIYWYPEGHLLTAITVYPCVIFLAIIVMMSGHEGGLLSLTTDAFNLIADQLSKQLNGDQAVFIHTVLGRLAKFAPAAIGCSWVTVIIISMLLAQYVLEQQKWHLRDDFALQSLQVPNWLIFAVAITGVIGVFTPAPYNYIGSNLSIILGYSFIFVGLAVIHAWAATTKAPTLTLIAFYILLTVFIWPVLLVVAVVGVLDQWVDFRRRMGKTKKSV